MYILKLEEALLKTLKKWKSECQPFQSYNVLKKILHSAIIDPAGCHMCQPWKFYLLIEKESDFGRNEIFVQGFQKSRFQNHISFRFWVISIDPAQNQILQRASTIFRVRVKCFKTYGTLQDFEWSSAGFL